MAIFFTLWEIQEVAIVCKHCGKELEQLSNHTKSVKTIVLAYRDERRMRTDIADKERKGWKVLGVQRVSQGYGAGRTCCFGIIFLPLALLGRKSDIFQVTYQFEEVIGETKRIDPQQSFRLIDIIVNILDELGKKLWKK